ncbi:MAG TPA: hypothetical protein VHZ76_00515 [Gammaproteobacteria bacterium]|jgi:hypothetical protein|nr:hypothetical protein [Gammaproteobacteria bacterium]
MMNQNNSDTVSPLPLEAVVSQFEHWRATRGKRGRIPNALWSLVAPLMDQYNHNEIVTALRLNYAQMKERVLPFLSQVPDKSATFVEYPLPSPSSAIESCIVEFTCRNGSAVKIRGLTATQLQPLVSMLLGV